MSLQPISSGGNVRAAKPLITLIDDPLMSDEHFDSTQSNGQPSKGADALLPSSSPASPEAPQPPYTRSSTPGGSRSSTESISNRTIHAYAQRGDLDSIQSLIHSGKATARDRDADGITPLHWAAINAHYPVCAYLLDPSDKDGGGAAEIDALGGELVASPLQWACRSGHLYIIHLLLSKGADPLIEDAQGFNALQLVVHSSSVMPLLYLLQQPAFAALSLAESRGGEEEGEEKKGIDARDTQGHTALMWAAYQGDAISVELLLSHGASLRAQDHLGLSPLHWAVVKGNRLCIRQLIEAGADLGLRQKEGKTPRDMAIELKSLASLEKALEDVGMDKSGRKGRRSNDKLRKAAVLVVPFCALGLIFWSFSILPWYTAFFLAGAEFFAMHHVVTRVLLDPKQVNSIQKSTYFLAIVSASIVWVGVEWAFKLVRGERKSPSLCLALDPL